MAKWEVIRKSRMSGSYEYDPIANCLPPGMPAMMSMAYGMEIMQNKDKITFFSEWQDALRRVYLDGRKPTQKIMNDPTYAGYSTGHWEGDTLVVDTTNQNDKTWFDTSGHYKPEDVHVVERFTMTDSNTIEYEAEVTSAEFTQPMKIKGRQTRANANNPDYEQMEFACIEGNQDVQHYTEDKGGKAKNVGARTQ